MENEFLNKFNKLSLTSDLVIATRNYSTKIFDTQSFKKDDLLVVNDQDYEEKMIQIKQEIPKSIY